VRRLDLQSLEATGRVRRIHWSQFCELLVSRRKLEWLREPSSLVDVQTQEIFVLEGGIPVWGPELTPESSSPSGRVLAQRS